MGGSLLVDVRSYVAIRLGAGLIAPSTAKNERTVLSGFARAMGARRVTQIGKNDIIAWLATIAHLEPGTRAGRFRIVSRYFEHVLDQPRTKLKRNPCRGVRPPKIPRPAHRALDSFQMGDLLMAAPDWMARCHIIIGAQCGLRVSEAANLQMGDINWRTKRMKIVGKGNVPRTVSISDEAMAVIERYLQERGGGRTSGPLFRQRRFPARGVSAQYLGEDFTAIAYAAGVKTAPRDGVSYHALRHTAATDVHGNCHSVTVVRDLLGHASIATTDIYLGSTALTELDVAVQGRSYMPAGLLGLVPSLGDADLGTPIPALAAAGLAPPAHAHGSAETVLSINRARDEVAVRPRLDHAQPCERCG